MSAYFIFNGIDSRDKNVGVKKLPPRFKPKERVELIQVPGRNGFLTQTDGTYESMSLSVECWLKKDANVYEVISWLKGGGTLVFSDDTDKQYQAVIVNAIPFERIFKLWKNFIIQFEAQPISYNKTETVVTKTANGTFTVGGTFEVSPILEIKGSGVGSITLNGTTIDLTGLSITPIIIDCDLMNATQGANSANSQVNCTDFPKLIIGTNNISMTGVTEVKIRYKEGWL